MYRFPLPSLRSLSALALVVSTGSLVQGTTLVRLAELPDLVAESRRAVLAEVLDVRYGYDVNGAHSTFVTLAVEDALYGRLPATGEELSLKLYGAPVELEDGSRLHVEGTPDYRTGQRYLLLLLDDSSLGFTNTTGLFQGAFLIEPAPDGPLARSLGGNRNAFGAAGLARWVDLDEYAPGAAAASNADAPVPYAALKSAILALRGERTASTGGAR